MLNRTRIAELKDEIGADDFLEVISLFCEEVEDVLDQMPTSSQDSLAEKLHFLKGSALNMGLDTVGQICATEEARLKVDPSAMPDFAALKTEYAAAKSMLFD